MAWASLAAIFLFGIFVVYLALLWVLASCVRIYRKIDELSQHGRKVPSPASSVPDGDEVAKSCHS